ncbi:MAG TPA: alpha/beta hydrolase-fold protein [Rhodopseudomonas sp.]|uniref:alpha/beta hydrolase n=1 Tax=Rhodopseudomonas sp. TaxID=1078 RepID=UPI002EDB0D34
MMANAVIPGASVRDIRSSAGREYRIFVWQPEHDAASESLPVLYLLDGNGSFPIAAAAAALQSRRPERTGVTPAVVVGIGYPTTSWLDAGRRTFDYTPALPQDLLPPRPNHEPWPATGGAEDFLDFLTHELCPQIEHEFSIDRARSALFGHSFGGLLVLHALFSRPALFRSYIAASPSIWFARERLLAQRERFLASAPQQLPRRLLLTVGSLEQIGAGQDPHDAWVRRNRMVENASELAGALSGADAALLAVSFTEFADEDHGSVLPAAISRALRFALGAA